MNNRQVVRMHRWFSLLMAVLVTCSLGAGNAFAVGKHDFDPAILQWLRTSVSLKTGMPFSYLVHGDRKDVYSRIGSPASPVGIIERIILDEGTSIYDAALWQIVLASTRQTEDLARARRPVEYYWNGSMERLLNLRTGSGQSIFIYDPHDPAAVTASPDDKGRRGFIFRIIDANGDYQMSDPLDGRQESEDFPNDPRIHWEDWKPIAGENAWVVLAALHVLMNDPDMPRGALIEQRPEFLLAEELARAAMYLQAENGGIRMAPLGTFYHLDGVTPDMDEPAIARALDARTALFKFPERVRAAMVRVAGVDHPEYHAWYYQEISTENNISWYAAFRMLYTLTGKQKYLVAMDRIEGYLKSVWDRQENIFYQGAHHTGGRWVPNTSTFAEDVQSWAIMAVGPKVLDEWFGEGAAYRLWQKTRQYAGVFSSEGRLLGVGFTRENDRVSIEWTAGAIMAVRRLADHYAFFHPTWAEGLRQDADDMRAGIDRYRFVSDEGAASYSYSSKRGWIPFGWFSQEPAVQSLVSTAWVALVDAGMNPFYLAFPPRTDVASALGMPVADFLRSSLRQAVAMSQGVLSFGIFFPGHAFYNLSR